MNIHRALAVGVTAALALAACGGDDPVSDPDQPVETVPARAAPDYDGPVSTLSPEIPESFDGSIGPMDQSGDDLPRLVVDEVADDTAVGTPAPVLLGVDLDGVPLRIDGANDGPTMVMFLAHWCPHCNDEIPVINEMRNDGRFPDELKIIAVSTSPAPDQPNFPPDEWLADRNWTYPAMLDGVDVDAGTFIGAEAYGVSAFPFTTLIDGDGNVAARWSGGRSADEIEANIETYLGLS